jgi:hypothetical protein
VRGKGIPCPCKGDKYLKRRWLISALWLKWAGLFKKLVLPQHFCIRYANLIVFGFFFFNSICIVSLIISIGISTALSFFLVHFYYSTVLVRIWFFFFFSFKGRERFIIWHGHTVRRGKIITSAHLQL